MPLTGSTIESYPTKDDRTLCLRRYRPQGEALADVVCLHGIISHAGWYDSSCQELSASGFDTHFLDRRGSGLNGGQRGDVADYQQWCDDVIGYLERLPHDRPKFLLGISWGGKLAPLIARRRPDLIDGLGLICPGIYARQQPGLMKRMGLRLSKWLNVSAPKVAVPLQDPRLFTDSPLWLEYLRDDPLTLREITLRFAREDLRLTMTTRQSAPFVKTPTLLVLAGRDRIVDNKKTRHFFAEISATEKCLLEYSQAAHTLEFESDPSVYFRDLINWLTHRAHQHQAGARSACTCRVMTNGSTLAASTSTPSPEPVNAFATPP